MKTQSAKGGCLKGGCLCGAIRFETSGAPRMVAICHCPSCRRQTGAAFATFVDFNKVQVTFIQGAPTCYASSRGVRRGFCPACGSTLTFEADNLPELIHLHLGAFDEPEKFAPTVEENVAFRLPWLPEMYPHG